MCRIVAFPRSKNYANSRKPGSDRVTIGNQTNFAIALSPQYFPMHRRPLPPDSAKVKSLPCSNPELTDCETMTRFPTVITHPLEYYALYRTCCQNWAKRYIRSFLNNHSIDCAPDVAVLAAAKSISAPIVQCP